MKTGRTSTSFQTLFSLALFGAAGFSLSACNDVEAAPETPSPRADLIVLGDGTTMVAREGARSRDIAEWLKGEGSGSRSYAFGTDGFIPESAQLSPLGLSRAVDLGTLLRATPNAKLVLYSDGNAVDALAESRAETVASFLGERGVLAGQVRVASTPDVVGAGSPRHRSGSLSFRLDRSSPTIATDPDA